MVIDPLSMTLGSRNSTRLCSEKKLPPGCHVVSFSWTLPFLKYHFFQKTILHHIQLTCYNYHPHISLWNDIWFMLTLRYFIVTSYVYLVPIFPYYIFLLWFHPIRPASIFTFASTTYLVFFVTKTEPNFHIPLLSTLIYFKTFP